MKENENFNMEPQLAAIFNTSEYNYTKVCKEEVQRYQETGEYPEELGQLAGMAFRAGELTYPWPGITVTQEAKEIGAKYGLDISWATWNRGIYDNGLEGCPYVYVYLREKAEDKILQAFCDEFDMNYYELEKEKSGLFKLEAEAISGRWEKLYQDLCEK